RTGNWPTRCCSRSLSSPRRSSRWPTTSSPTEPNRRRRSRRSTASSSPRTTSTTWSTISSTRSDPRRDGARPGWSRRLLRLFRRGSSVVRHLQEEGGAADSGSSGPASPRRSSRHMKERLLMTSASTTRDEVPTPGSADETFLDRIGIPHVLRWGFLGVLIFMTGNAVETNFVSPHMANVFGGGDEKINLAATIITLYSLASLIGSYLAGAFSDLWGPQRVMLLGLVVWLVFQAAFIAALATG